MANSNKAQQLAEQMIENFRSGDVVEPLAQMLIRRNGDYPSIAWSWTNRLLCGARGHYDCRGYGQWKKVGRQVRRGQKSIKIFVPFKRKVEDEETGEATHRVQGFGVASVFGYHQTEGAPLPGHEDEAAYIAGLPLVDVATRWGLTVSTADVEMLGALGVYVGGEAKRIDLATQNLSTWAHELVHAADDRRGELRGPADTKIDREIVAEFGGAILLECLGLGNSASDRGGALEYIQGYAGSNALKFCSRLTDRTCSAVALILDTADELAATAAVAA